MVISKRLATMSGDQLRHAIRDAYVYAYPLVLMDITRQVSTNVSSATELMGKAPMNQLAHVRIFVPASSREVVRPNRDTLYSIAWLDLSAEPLVLDIAGTGDTYYLLPILNAWTDIHAHSPGSRTTGNGKQSHVICGPDWTGPLPHGLPVIRMSTSMAWIIGRTECHGPADYQRVWAIQDGYRLVPLSVWPRPYTPPIDVPKLVTIDMNTPPPRQVQALSQPDASPFFTRFCQLMAAAPPSPPDPAVAAMSSVLGFIPGAIIDFNQYPDEVIALVQQGVADARQQIETAFHTIGTEVNGWHYQLRKIGAFGTDYLLRAAVAYGGLGANLVTDAVYPITDTAQTATGPQPLDGSKRYTIHFPPGQTPPMNGFWSITAYDSSGYLIPNPQDKHAVHDWDTEPNDDGSLDIVIQADEPVPERQKTNWLPVAAGQPFNLTMRIYWPKTTRPTVLDLSWTAPPVTPA